MSEVVNAPRVVVTFSPTEINYFRQVFNLFDPRRTGSLPTSQTGMLLRSLGQNPTESELKNLIDEVDSDRSGSLEFDEFVDLMAATFKSKEEQEEEIRAAFLTFDADGSGFITREELIVTLTTMGDPIDEETINLMVAEADKDGDGQINYREFTKIMLDA